MFVEVYCAATYCIQFLLLALRRARFKAAHAVVALCVQQNFLVLGKKLWPGLCWIIVEGT